MEQIIRDAMDFAQKLFETDFSGHDFSHTLRVFRTATALARQEGAELTTVQLAALLHDVDDRKLSPETAGTKARAAGFLRAHGLPQAQIETILTIIGEVSFVGTDSVIPATAEGRCVQDADRLDAIGAVGIGRAFAYGGAHGRAMHDPAIPPRVGMDAAAYRASLSTTVNHFYEKLFLLEDLMQTAAAKELARARTAYMRDFLAEFLAEWDGER